MTISDDEAVEAAALVLYRIDQWERVTAWPTEEDLKRGRSIFDPPPTLDEFKADYIRDARLVLAAAAPFIRAEALEEAADDWQQRSDTFMKTMEHMASSRDDYTADDVLRYAAYSAEANTTAYKLRTRARARAAEMRQG